MDNAAFYRIATLKEMLIPAHVQFMDGARLICIKKGAEETKNEPPSLS